MTFCFRCPFCEFRVETQTRVPEPLCPLHGASTVRDWKAEGVGVGSGVKVSRDGLLADQARVFLPTNTEMAGPGDPDGTKGMRDWREKHAPKADNRKPFWPGEVERKVF